MNSRRDLLKWLSAMPLLAPLLARAEVGSPPSTAAKRKRPYPDKAELEKSLHDTLEALRKVPLANQDAPDVLPRAGALADARARRTR